MNPLEIVIPVEATGLFQYAWLMIAIPLGVAAILLLGGRATNAWGHWLGVLGVVGSFAVAAALFAQMLGADIADRAVQVPMFEWISVGNLHLSAALLQQRRQLHRRKLSLRQCHPIARHNHHPRRTGQLFHGD